MNLNNKLQFSSELIQSINFMLLTELNSLILSPEAGIQKIRKVLYQFGLDIPALYEASRDGDEVIFDVSDFFTDSEDSLVLYLYFIYYQTEDGNYDFHAELVEPNNLDDFLNDEIYDYDENDDDGLNAVRESD